MSQTHTEDATAERKQPRTMTGEVIAAKMQLTAVVRVETRKMHPKYKKTIRRHAKYLAHNDGNQAKVGDLVEISATRPLSKLKRWRISQIVKKAE
jgi:small subunit ribosomal protein S17